jgi:hypothetical protein
MKNKADLREIAELNGLTYAESTSGSNGYPNNIKGIIIGFDNFKDAEELAEKHGLSIEFFTKKDGWDLWERTNNQAHEPMKNSSDDYGDNYHQFEKMSEEEYILQEITPYIKDNLEDTPTFEKMSELLELHKEIYSGIEEMKDDEILITQFEGGYETIKKESMYFAHDTKHITIGLIDRN